MASLSFLLFCYVYIKSDASWERMNTCRLVLLLQLVRKHETHVNSARWERERDAIACRLYFGQMILKCFISCLLSIYLKRTQEPYLLLCQYLSFEFLFRWYKSCSTCTRFTWRCICIQKSFIIHHYKINNTLCHLTLL